nr:hypothetical protein [Acidobacteriota bacterium]
WKPMEGSSSKVEIMGIAGGAQVDIRGANAPVPAASRLFVDTSEADKVTVPFLRATLRHTLELTSKKSDELSWRRWMNYLLTTVRTVPYWRWAVREEYDLLESSMKYAVVNEQRFEYLSRQEVIDRYGSWAPLHTSYKEGDKAIQLNGIYQDAITDMLIAFKETRQSGRQTEINMSSFVMADSIY